MIIPMNETHAHEVGKLHHKFIASFLKDLGERMCIKFYECAIRQETNFGFVYHKDDKVLGFIFGTLDNSKLFQPFPIKAELLFSLLKRPQFISRMFQRIKGEFLPAPERCYWATDIPIRRKGIGKKLYMTLHDEFEKRGVDFYQMRIDCDNDASLNATQKTFAAEIKDVFFDNGKKRYRLEVKIAE
jgi:hypothetical protein